MQEFLVAATRATDADGRIFRLDDICGSLDWECIDCDRVAALLEKEGLLNRLPDGKAILTTAGVQAANEP
jgi:hypothetical protein